MFSTFRDEIQYIFLEKNFIFMVFLAVKDVGTNVNSGNANEIPFVSSYKKDLNDVSSSKFNSGKKLMKIKFFTEKIYRISS